MAQVFKGSCPNCQYTRDFFLGFGKMSINLLASLRVLNEQEQKEINTLLNNKQVKDFIVENKLVECSCSQPMEKLKDKTIITITTHSGSTLVFGDRCDKCKDTFVIHPNLEDVPCPCCQDSILTFSITGHWI